MRQIGSALGAAFSGATLAMALAATLPSALTAAGITGAAADEVASATRQSAGTTILQMRMQGVHSPFGQQTSAVVEALSNGFAQATQVSMLVASVFLLLGLVGAWRLRRASGE